MNGESVESPLPAETLAELGGLQDDAARRSFLRLRPELLRPGTVEQLAEAVRQSLRVDVELALRLAETAVVVANELSDPKSIGLGLRAKANALWFRNDLRAAVVLFEQAVASFEKAGQEDEIGRTLSSSIQALALLGEYKRALETADRARAIFEQLNDRRRLARLEINIANIHHRQDRFSEALASYQRAYEELMPYKDAEALGVALHNSAVCLIMLNEFDRAMATYHRVRQLCEQNGMPLLAAQADYNIAYLYFLRGNYNKALEGLRATRELCRSNHDAYHAALCDLDESEIYLELNLTEEARHMAAEARQAFGKLGMKFEEGRSVVNLAIATHRANDPIRAVQLLSEAREIFARESNEAWRALTRLYQAMVLTGVGQFQRAALLSQRALRFFESAGLERRAILCQLLRIRISVMQGRLREARRLCEVVRRRVEPADAPLLIFQTHLLMGHIQLGLNQGRAAYASYQRARDELEKLRTSVQSDELKIAFMKDKVEVYEGLVDLCLKTPFDRSVEQAFDFMEQAKSRSLVDLLFGPAMPVPWQIPTELRPRLADLRGELNWCYHRLDIEQTRQEGLSTQRVNQLRETAHILEDRFLRTIRELPVMADSPTASPAGRVLSLEQVQAALPRDTALLEYFETGGQFIGVIVTRNTTKLIRLGNVSAVTVSLQMLEFQMSRLRVPEFSADVNPELLETAVNNRLRELYRYVFAPATPYLQASRLIVIPHGVLHYVPFHALYDGTRYLIDHLTVSYAPSSSIYAGFDAKRASGGGASLLLGIDDEQAPWMQEEIRSVAKVVPDPKIYTGTAATTEVLRTEGPDSRIIHIATHGTFRRDNPLFSNVRLTDSYLSLYDLYGMKLPVELFTLSGCGTGLSEVTGGDELLGLTRGLLCAGAQAALVTLWDVNDHTTAEFMSLFYGELKKKADKATAVRTAMLEVRRSFSHPYYWAPFILVGKMCRSENNFE